MLSSFFQTPATRFCSLNLKPSIIRSCWPRIIVAVMWAILIGEASTAMGASVNPCTDAALRMAVHGGGTVTFDCDGTILLTNTIIIDHDTILDASGHNVLISGNNSVRVFPVNTGVTF